MKSTERVSKLIDKLSRIGSKAVRTRLFKELLIIGMRNDMSGVYKHYKVRMSDRLTNLRMKDFIHAMKIVLKMVTVVK